MTDSASGAGPVPCACPTQGFSVEGCSVWGSQGTGHGDMSVCAKCQHGLNGCRFMAGRRVEEEPSRGARSRESSRDIAPCLDGEGGGPGEGHGHRLGILSRPGCCGGYKSGLERGPTIDVDFWVRPPAAISPAYVNRTRRECVYFLVLGFSKLSLDVAVAGPIQRANHSTLRTGLGASWRNVVGRTKVSTKPATLT